ncbi:MAG: hypothetical protein ACAH80_05940 [Alphaproteobacteria bacterium]
MLPLTRAAHLPYTATPLKYRRADIAPASGVEDIEEGDNETLTAGENDAGEALTLFVPLPFKGQLIDKLI